MMNMKVMMKMMSHGEIILKSIIILFLAKENHDVII